MGCSCEALVDCPDERLAEALLDEAQDEARRAEEKFSRYREGSVVHRLNAAGGRSVDVDEETAQLLNFADECWRLSGGLFDVTTGALRRAWRFEPSAPLPGARDVAEARKLVGWEKARWDGSRLRLRPGMEIDLGGIGKEYAVDRALGRMRARADAPLLVNFGGDVAARGPLRDGRPWLVGIEKAGADALASRVVGLTRGALATSGDSRRFVIKDGRRYGHVLDPRTGRPVEGAPRSVTVAADTCTEAGFLSTLALLKGPEAESFLRAAGARFWVER